MTRDWADSDYSRIYHAVIGDKKLGPIYVDDRAWAAYTRLLIGADAMYPAPAPLPRSLGKYAQQKLIDAGVLILSGTDHYTLSGHKTEREGRARESVNGGTVRAATAQRGGNGRFLPVDAGPAVVASGGDQRNQPRRDETSKDETRRDDARPPLMTVIDYIEERSGRPYSFGPGSKVHECLSPDVRDFGPDAVIAAMKADTTLHPDIGQLVFNASKVFHPFSTPDPKAAARAERDADEKRASDARFAATQRLIQEQERRRGDA